jgi:glycosyltransferase involved in cell wall biosynthesis
MNDIKLSICMMVKNEEENLDRCLTSIKKTCAREDVELIILDTGSSDGTVEIARRFTDKVYFHAWNNDFSDMRNKSISHAKGEWILILDADEEFDDENSVIDLLEFNKLYSYNTVQITLRNFTKSDRNIFSQLPTLRFFKNKEFRYNGSVHNQPCYQTPIYYDTNIILNHYGYNNDDKRLMERKYQRTKTLLLKELEKNPNNIYYLYQLTQSYFMNGEYLQAYESIKKTLKLLKTQVDKANHVYLFERYASICITLDRYTEAEQISQEGICVNPEYIDLYFINVFSKVKNGKKEESISYIKKYLELIQNLEKLNISKNPSIELYRVSTRDIDMMLTELVNFYIDKKEFTQSLKYLNKVKNNELKDKLIIIYSFAKTDFNILLEHYNKIKNRKEDFQILLEKQINTLNEDDKNKFYRTFSKGGNLYAQFNKMRAANELDNNAGLLKSLEYSVNFNEMPSFYLQILLKTFSDDPNRFFHTLKKVKSSFVRNLISNYFISNELLKKELIYYLSSKSVRESDIHGNRIFYILASVILLDAVENKEIKANYKIYQKYVLAGSNFTSSLYNFNSLKLIYKTLDELEIKFFVIQLIIKELKIRKDFHQMLKLYHEALKALPMLSEFIKKDIEIIEKEINA